VEEDVASLRCRNWTTVALNREGWRKLLKEAEAHPGLQRRWREREKVHARTGHGGPKGEERYNSTLSLTSALEVGGWSTPRPGRIYIYIYIFYAL
jgi:hypothetical protein